MNSSGPTSKSSSETRARLLQQLHKQLAGNTAHPTLELDQPHLEADLKSKTDERARVLALFRKGRISDAELEVQLDDIAAEEEGLRRSLAALDDQSETAAQTDAYLSSAGALLAALRARGSMRASRGN